MCVYHQIGIFRFCLSYSLDNSPDNDQFLLLLLLLCSFYLLNMSACLLYMCVFLIYLLFCLNYSSPARSSNSTHIIVLSHDSHPASLPFNVFETRARVGRQCQVGRIIMGKKHTLEYLCDYSLALVRPTTHPIVSYNLCLDHPLGSSAASASISLHHS